QIYPYARLFLISTPRYFDYRYALRLQDHFPSRLHPSSSQRGLNQAPAQLTFVLLQNHRGLQSSIDALTLDQLVVSFLLRFSEQSSFRNLLGVKKHFPLFINISASISKIERNISLHNTHCGMPSKRTLPSFNTMSRSL